MKKNTIKLLSIVLIALLLITSTFTFVNADKASEIDINNMYSSAEDTTGASGSMNRIIGSIITVAQVVGIGVAIIMLIVLAIKYISAAPSDKAEIKKHAVVYVVGAVVLFAASGILQIIKNFAGNVHA